jgi:hypothetical protein
VLIWRHSVSVEANLETQNRGYILRRKKSSCVHREIDRAKKSSFSGSNWPFEASNPLFASVWAFFYPRDEEDPAHFLNNELLNSDAAFWAATAEKGLRQLLIYFGVKNVGQIGAVGTLKNQNRFRKSEDAIKADALIGPAIRHIRKTWAKLGSRQLGAGPYGKQQLLQEIYGVYRSWRDRGLIQEIWARLAAALKDQTIDESAHLVDLLIRVALPELQTQVAANWVDAIRYGESHHVRPSKLRGFLFVKGGLVRCALYQRQTQKNKGGQKDITRFETEDGEARSEQARSERRRRTRRSIPVGMRGLFDD